jgi:hypothetical protein
MKIYKLTEFPHLSGSEEKKKPTHTLKPNWCALDCNIICYVKLICYKLLLLSIHNKHTNRKYKKKIKINKTTHIRGDMKMCSTTESRVYHDQRSREAWLFDMSVFHTSRLSCVVDTMPSLMDLYVYLVDL